MIAVWHEAYIVERKKEGEQDHEKETCKSLRNIRKSFQYNEPQLLRHEEPYNLMSNLPRSLRTSSASPVSWCTTVPKYKRICII